MPYDTCTYAHLGFPTAEKKYNRKLYILRSVKFLKRQTLDVLYKIQVRSCIDYMLPVYYHTLRQREKSHIEQIQYKAAKLASGALHYTSQLKLEKEMGWESITERADFLGLTLFHKIHTHNTRPLIRNCMPRLADCNTRSIGTYLTFNKVGKSIFLMLCKIKI